MWSIRWTKEIRAHKSTKAFNLNISLTGERVLKIFNYSIISLDIIVLLGCHVSVTYNGKRMYNVLSSKNTDNINSIISKN